jgi:hypothetical protein
MVDRIFRGTGSSCGCVRTPAYFCWCRLSLSPSSCSLSLPGWSALFLLLLLFSDAVTADSLGVVGWMFQVLNCVRGFLFLRVVRALRVFCTCVSGIAVSVPVLDFGRLSFVQAVPGRRFACSRVFSGWWAAHLAWLINGGCCTVLFSWYYFWGGCLHLAALCRCCSVFLFFFFPSLALCCVCFTVTLSLSIGFRFIYLFLVWWRSPSCWFLVWRFLWLLSFLLLCSSLSFLFLFCHVLLVSGYSLHLVSGAVLCGFLEPILTSVFTVGILYLVVVVVQDRPQLIHDRCTLPRHGHVPGSGSHQFLGVPSVQLMQQFASPIFNQHPVFMSLSHAWIFGLLF